MKASLIKHYRPPVSSTPGPESIIRPAVVWLSDSHFEKMSVLAYHELEFKKARLHNAFHFTSFVSATLHSDGPEIRRTSHRDFNYCKACMFQEAISGLGGRQYENRND